MANPTQFQEPNGEVTYTVNIANPNGATDPITITNISETVAINNFPDLLAFVDLTQTFVPFPGARWPGHGQLLCCPRPLIRLLWWVSTQCPVSSRSPTPSRQNADSIVDVVTVDGTDPFGQPVSDSDSETVTVSNRDPVIRVDKQNPQGQTTIVAPGGSATWTIAVFNDGDPVLGEPLTLTGVTDQLQVDNRLRRPARHHHGGRPGHRHDLRQHRRRIGHDPARRGALHLPDHRRHLAVGPLVVGQDQVLTNIVTVTGRDDDPAPYVRRGHLDPADKNVVATAPVLEVFKTDFEATVAEPGMDIEYTIDITNSGQVGSANAIRIDRITRPRSSRPRPAERPWSVPRRSRTSCWRPDRDHPSHRRGRRSGVAVGRRRPARRHPGRHHV